MNENEQQANSPEPQMLEEPAQAAFKPLRSITRLVVGGVELGLRELLARLQEYEGSIEENQVPEPARRVIAAQASGEPPAEPDSQQELLRLALIGWMFDAQEQLGPRLRPLQRAGRLVGRIAGELWSPLGESRLMRPARNRYEELVARGESEVERWIAIGRRESARSQQLAEMAYHDVVEDYIEYLAENPEVQELVQTQSTGLATELVEEVRERTVSADTFLEGIARSILRRAPRGRLPGPPPEVRMSATRVRPTPPEERAQLKDERQ